MKSLDVSRTSWFVIGAILLSASLLSGRCFAGISIGEIYGPLSLDSSWPPQAEYGPCWSPDGTKIAFAYGDGYTAWDPSLGRPNPDGSYICIMTADGNSVRGPDNPLVNDVGWDNHSPDWGPDHGPYPNWIVYSGTRVGPAYIARVNPDDGTVVQIPGTIGGHPKKPKWSPDGTKIAYLGGDWHASPNPYHICLTDPDGSFHENLTQNMTVYEEGVHGLSWSPDGSQIVFTQYGLSGLFVLNVATSNVTELSGFPSDLTPGEPVWCSDDDSILFRADGGIYCYQIDTQETEQLTYGPGDGSGDWHPTAGLVFSSSRDTIVRWDSNIYIAAPAQVSVSALLAKLIGEFQGLQDILRPVDPDAYTQVLDECLKPALSSITRENYLYINDQDGIKGGKVFFLLLATACNKIETNFIASGRLSSSEEAKLSEMQRGLVEMGRILAMTVLSELGDVGLSNPKATEKYGKAVDYLLQALSETSCADQIEKYGDAWTAATEALEEEFGVKSGIATVSIQKLIMAKSFVSDIVNAELRKVGQVTGEVRLYAPDPFIESRASNVILEVSVLSPIGQYYRWYLRGGIVTVAYDDAVGEIAGEARNTVNYFFNTPHGEWEELPPPDPFWVYWGPALGRISQLVLSFVPVVGQVMDIGDATADLAFIFGKEEVDPSELSEIENQFDIKTIPLYSTLLNLYKGINVGGFSFRTEIPLRFTKSGEYPLHIAVTASMAEHLADPLGGDYFSDIEESLHVTIKAQEQ